MELCLSLQGVPVVPVTRSRRAAIQREAGQIRRRCQREGQTTERIVAAIRDGLPEVSALEACRFALGWSRADTVAQIAALYHGDGLRPPGLSEQMLCRWEHGAERPGPEYARMLCRVYRTGPAQLGLETEGPLPRAVVSHRSPVRYDQRKQGATGAGGPEG
ncbi:hypothetical protein ACGF5C_27370 [Micromonospora sp. NPDC047620]|uniref:hypothetical protein n=1 Tax=Micromonospora sp. NPDC047620 TaxID=3364251 RepID=UPI003718C79E